MATDVKVPTLGESITEATVGQWLKAPGDTVALDEPIVSLETDKVSVEVPSPVAGTLGEQLFAEGDTVEVGAIVARINEGAAAASAPAPATEPVTNPAGPAETPALRGDEHAPEAAKPGSANDASLTLSPAVRRAVLEHHVDPSAIKGSGKDGRLTKDDVIAAAKSKESLPPVVPAKAGTSGQENEAPASPRDPRRRRDDGRTEESGKI